MAEVEAQGRRFYVHRLQLIEHRLEVEIELKGPLKIEYQETPMGAAIWPYTLYGDDDKLCWRGVAPTFGTEIPDGATWTMTVGTELAGQMTEEYRRYLS